MYDTMIIFQRDLLGNGTNSLSKVLIKSISLIKLMLVHMSKYAIE